MFFARLGKISSRNWWTILKSAREIGFPLDRPIRFPGKIVSNPVYQRPTETGGMQSALVRRILK